MIFKLYILGIFIALIVNRRSVSLLAHGISTEIHAALLTDVTLLGRAVPLKRANRDVTSLPCLNEPSPISKYSCELLK